MPLEHSILDSFDFLLTFRVIFEQRYLLLVGQKEKLISKNATSKFQVSENVYEVISRPGESRLFAQSDLQ